MAKVQVPAHWVAASYLPPICARHGGPATAFQQRKLFSRAPAWSYLLIPLGLLIFAIVTLAIRTTVQCRLPSCSRCSADRRRFIMGVVSLWVATVGVFVLGVQLESGALVGLGFVAIVVDLIACFTGDYFRAAGHVSKDRAWVNFTRVDHAFATAVNNAVRPAAPVLTPTGAPAVAYYASPNILPGQ